MPLWRQRSLVVVQPSKAFSPGGTPGLQPEEMLWEDADPIIFEDGDPQMTES